MKIGRLVTGAGKAWGTILTCTLIVLLVNTQMLAGAGSEPDTAPSSSGWELIPTSNFGSMYSLDMVDSSFGWAGGARGSLYAYNGADWFVGAIMDFEDIISGIHLLNTSSGWAVTNRGKFLRFIGGFWTVHSEPVVEWLDDLHMTSETDGWAVGEGGTILRFNGSSWNEVNSPTSNWLDSVEMVHANEGWIVGGSGTIMHWTGSGWSKLTSTWGQPWLHDVDMVSATDGWVVGSQGIILHYNGSNWSEVASPTSEVLWDVHMDSSDLGWAVGDRGTILEYKGGTWNEVLPSLTSRGINALDGVSASDVWAVGGIGTILHYTGGPDVSLSSKAASPGRAMVGDMLTYTIRVENSGTQSAPSVLVSDAIPDKTTYVGGSASPPPDSGPDPIVWTVTDLGPGEHVDLTFEVEVEGPEPEPYCFFVENTATIEMDGVQLTPRTITSVGDECKSIFLPLVSQRWQ